MAMRALFIWIFAFGFLGALVGHIPSRSSGKVPDAIQQSFDDEKARIAELKAKNQPQFSTDDGSIALDRDSDGHFYADVRINGNPVHMLIDTGASGIALSRSSGMSIRRPSIDTPSFICTAAMAYGTSPACPRGATRMKAIRRSTGRNSCFAQPRKSSSDRPCVRKPHWN